jgi:hypothetical protein
VGGLSPGESKQIQAKIYLLKNDPQQLMQVYRRDFRENAR